VISQKWQDTAASNFLPPFFLKIAAPLSKSQGAFGRQQQDRALTNMRSAFSFWRTTQSAVVVYDTVDVHRASTEM
jgi:hypothetical protein